MFSNKFFSFPDKMACKMDNMGNNLIVKDCGRHFLRALYVWLYHGICKTALEAKHYFLLLRDKEGKD